MSDEALQQEPIALSTVLPAAQFAYLKFLASHGMFGTTEAEVASYILSETLKKMEADGIHNQQPT